MKMTTKLLLGATLVAGLSVSAFAACASHVDMGTKKLENVGAGTDDGDAVNYAQTLKLQTLTPSWSDGNISAYDARWSTDIRKVGAVCSFGGYMKITDSQTGSMTANLPEGYRGYSYSVAMATGTNASGMRVTIDNISNTIKLYADYSSSLSWIPIHLTYLCK